MKKTLYLPFVLLCTLFIVSCSDEELVRNREEVKVTASLADSRTTYQEGENVIHTLWEQGDAIGLTTDTQKNLKYTADVAGASTTFSPTSTTLDNVDGTQVYAYYPYSASGNGMEVALPDINTQHHAEGKSNVDFIYADGTISSSTLELKKFTHLFTFLKVTLPLESLPLDGNNHMLYIWSQSAPINILNGTFNLETKQIGANTGASDPNNKKYNNLFYSISPSSLPQGATQVTCYIAMLPQPGYADISFHTYQNGKVTGTILNKKAPAEGFQAGRVYSITLDGTEEKPDLKKERDALTDLYNSTNGGNWTYKTNWLTDKGLGDWYGVGTQSVTGRVFNLQLIQNNLTGTLPASIGDLSGINHLNLSFNKISGAFPESLSKLMDIPTGNLRLEYNHFSTDDIPASITSHPNWDKHWMSFVVQATSPRTEDLTKYNIDAPDFSVTDLDGQTIDSATEYANNKLTIFFRWNDNYSNMGNLNSLYNLYKDKGLNIIGYHPNCKDVAAYKKHLESSDIHWRNFASISPSNWIPEFSAYEIWSSHYFVVDEHKKVIHRSVDPASSELSNLVREKLGDPVLYTSTDYSKDGEVFTIQKATVGKGINLVFMGEGFVDTDMNDGGKYEQQMKAAVDKLFELEPYTSLRDRFNIYAVKAVSPNAEFVSGAEHKFEEEKKETTSNGYQKSDATAFEYAKKITEADWNKQRMMISVIYNTTVYTGRSYCRTYSNDGTFVAYMMEGINKVIIHEVAGHGIAHLLDEYVEPGYEDTSIPTTMENMGTAYLDWCKAKEWGWAANVDYKKAPDVKWNHMLTDSRYSSEVFVREGSNTYGKGAYRPSENSMMNQNILWFNAPSREAIYKAVMTMSEGEEWLSTYDFENFAAFDANNRGTQPFSARSAASDAERRKWQESHRPPVFVEGSWQDVLKGHITVPFR